MDTKSVGVVALNLMQKNNGPGVTDQERWASFLGFVADAATQGSLTKLRSVSGKLRCIQNCLLISVRTHFLMRRQMSGH